MNHRALYAGFGIACTVCLVLSILAFRPAPDFPREAPLVTKLPPNLDEWTEEK